MEEPTHPCDSRQPNGNLLSSRPCLEASWTRTSNLSDFKKAATFQEILTKPPRALSKAELTSVASTKTHFQQKRRYMPYHYHTVSSIFQLCDQRSLDFVWLGSFSFGLPQVARLNVLVTGHWAYQMEPSNMANNGTRIKLRAPCIYDYSINYGFRCALWWSNYGLCCAFLVVQIVPPVVVWLVQLCLRSKNVKDFDFYFVFSPIHYAQFFAM